MDADRVMHVLLCDDDPTSRALIRRLMEGYFKSTVTECNNGLDALELLGKQPFSLLFLDLTMPVMDGLETLTRIRQSPQTRDLPVIILSGENDRDAIETILKLGITDYVLKPARTQSVISKIERILKTLPNS